MTSGSDRAVNTTVWPTTVGADQVLVSPVASFQVGVSVVAGPAVTGMQLSVRVSVSVPVAVGPIAQVLRLILSSVARSPQVSIFVGQGRDLCLIFEAGYAGLIPVARSGV